MHHHKFLAALPLALAVSAAWAADDGYTTLDTSVISASGYAQDTREAPASITVIDSKELMTKPIGDIGTAVSDVPGVDITTTKMGTSQIYIRGFSSDYTLLMVDGRRQNSDSAMNSLNGFEAGGIFMPPPGAVERVEVMRGPASTIYGSDGIGGAVNIIMKKHVNQFTGSLSIDRTQFTDSDWDDRWSAGAYLGIPLKEGVASLLLRGRYFDREKSNLHSPSGGYASHSPSDGYTGNIGGGSGFHHNTGLRRYAVGRRFSTPAAYLLLRHKGKVQIKGKLLFQKLNEHSASRTVVDCLGLHYAAAEIKHRGKGDHIP